MTVVLCAAALAAGAVRQETPQYVYLFDCGGTVQRLSDADVPAGDARRVSDLDPALPSEVRDGCAILSGWYDTGSSQLLLRVQTAGRQRGDSTPTRMLALAVPGLVPVGRGIQAAPRFERSARAELIRQVRRLEAPFPRSIAYVLNGYDSVLFQELQEDSSAGPMSVQPDILWRAGTVSLREAHPHATGRYAVADLSTGAVRGSVVTAPQGSAQQRVVCFTPQGRVYVAAARDTLAVLDTTRSDGRAVQAAVTLDLYWTACAWE
jgi:hypothetical protein